MTEKKKQVYKPKELSEESARQLSEKYGIPQQEIQTMARELRFGRPRLEMHLIYLANEAKRKRL